MGAPVTVTFLGGLGEIGRNCAVIETAETGTPRRVMLDCGQMFAGDDLPGVDSIYPDFDWLLEQPAPELEACIASHAHEDHIGALPYLLTELEFPIYGSPFTLALIRHKLNEAGLTGRTELHLLKDGDVIELGPFTCEVLPVTHSIPGGLITAFHTPQGVILHSSDFKLDHTPVDGRRTGLTRIGAIAVDPGIRLLLADSTNADQSGSTQSETEVGAVLHELIAELTGRRIIVGAFASHIHRIQQIADAAIANGRYLVTLGRSMGRNVTLARELGLLKIPDDALRDAAEIETLDPAKVLIVSTGSQAEPAAAITQMANRTNKWIEVGNNDTVILSAHPIPGNEVAVATVRNKLSRAGAQIIAGEGVHTSGHGHADELAVLHSVASPEWFVPVHGEYEHLLAHAELARTLGMDTEQVVLCTDGDQIELNDDGIAHKGSVGGRHLYVDGMVDGLGSSVLKDRRKLKSGVVTITVCIDLDLGEIIGDPLVTSRGWVEPPASYDQEQAVAKAVAETLSDALIDGEDDLDAFERLTRRAAGSTISERTRRRPVIMPQIVPISPNSANI